ncbi:helix-turn-helix transcriptional regulator [Methylocystis echinoides]|uniref:DNA-binding protein n=1 Tax=Methylocystis echinoides TaxID=29468 RepID=A0A9W6LPW1_9HYPH|nr:helix-turn-helix transcriptional regulator [Methylocystis echinoides]GLI91028.1 DNA-binding protein [Methylocystis echinoides]
MSEYFTTRELAALLRIKERKVYDLVSEKAVPVRRVTGKLLFPRKEIEEWIAGGSVGGTIATGAPPPTLPLIISGGHDPLLEWALRESRCGIAALLDGALDGLERMKAHGCLAAGLHVPMEDLTEWNIGAVREAFATEPVVLVEWARRNRGLMYRPTIRKPIRKLADLGDLRFQARQPEAGSELILSALLSNEGLERSDLNIVEAIERTETDLAMAVAGGRADVGLGIEAVAQSLQLGFTPLVVERFDLLVWRKTWFDPPFQKFIRFCNSEAFRERARRFGGYDCAGFGTVHFNGP